MYLAISLPKIPYMHRIYMVLASPKSECADRRGLSWDILVIFYWVGKMLIFMIIDCVSSHNEILTRGLSWFTYELIEREDWICFDVISRYHASNWMAVGWAVVEAISAERLFQFPRILG